ncbi:MAG: hypothetical protein WBG71_00075 [Leeuwenhoekiella sp.]
MIKIFTSLLLGLFCCVTSAQELSNRDFIKTFEGAVNGSTYLAKITCSNGTLYTTVIDKSTNIVSTNNGALLKNGELRIPIDIFAPDEDAALIGHFVSETKIEGKLMVSDSLQNLVDRGSFFLIEHSVDIDSEKQAAQWNREQSRFKTLVIDAVHLSKFPQYQESGEPWDSSWSGYFPDLYLKIYNKAGKVLYNQANRYDDCKNDKLPLVVRLPPTVKFSESDYSEGIAVVFMDDDSSTSDDLVCGFEIPTFGKHWRADPNIQEFNFDTMETKIEYHYEQ